MSSHPMPHQLFYHGAILLMVILSVYFSSTLRLLHSGMEKKRTEALKFMFAGSFLLKNYLNIKSVDCDK